MGGWAHSVVGVYLCGRQGEVWPGSWGGGGGTSLMRRRKLVQVKSIEFLTKMDDASKCATWKRSYPSGSQGVEPRVLPINALDQSCVSLH